MDRVRLLDRCGSEFQMVRAPEVLEDCHSRAGIARSEGVMLSAGLSSVSESSSFCLSRATGQRLEPSLTFHMGRKAAEHRMGQRLELSLTSLRAKAGAFAYVGGAKAGAFAYVVESKGWSLRLHR